MLIVKGHAHRSLDFHDVRYDQFLAIIRAVEHEIVRSNNRVKDERIVGDAHERECMNLTCLSDLLRRMREHEGMAHRESALVVH